MTRNATNGNDPDIPKPPTRPIPMPKPKAARQLRHDMWRRKLPPADVVAFYVRGPGCVRFAP